MMRFRDEWLIHMSDEDRAVARLSEILALECGVHPVTARQLRAVAGLHDIGKMMIPEHILNKPGKLNRQEFEVMKSHTKIGASMLSCMGGELRIMAQTICCYHHEWYDGVGGYWGQRTDSLPMYLPLVSMSDVCIALISNRVYKPAWPLNEALDYLDHQAGSQFSPVLVETFRSLVRDDRRVQGILGMIAAKSSQER